MQTAHLQNDGVVVQKDGVISAGDNLLKVEPLQPHLQNNKTSCFQKFATSELVVSCLSLFSCIHLFKRQEECDGGLKERCSAPWNLYRKNVIGPNLLVEQTVKDGQTQDEREVEHRTIRGSSCLRS